MHIFLKRKCSLTVSAVVVDGFCVSACSFIQTIANVKHKTLDLSLKYFDEDFSPCCCYFQRASGLHLVHSLPARRGSEDEFLRRPLHRRDRRQEPRHYRLQRQVQVGILRIMKITTKITEYEVQSLLVII